MNLFDCVYTYVYCVSALLYSSIWQIKEEKKKLIKYECSAPWMYVFVSPIPMLVPISFLYFSHAQPSHYARIHNALCVRTSVMRKRYTVGANPAHSDSDHALGFNCLVKQFGISWLVSRCWQDHMVSERTSREYQFGVHCRMTELTAQRRHSMGLTKFQMRHGKPLARCNAPEKFIHWAYIRKQNSRRIGGWESTGRVTHSCAMTNEWSLIMWQGGVSVDSPIQDALEFTWTILKSKAQLFVIGSNCIMRQLLRQIMGWSDPCDDILYTNYLARRNRPEAC